MHRILHIIPSLSPSGTTAQLSLLASGLPRDEFEIHVTALNHVAPTKTALPFSNAATMIVSPQRRFAIDPLVIWRLKRHIQRLRPDLVHTWLFEANSYGRAAALMAGVRRLVATERHLDTWKSSPELALDRWLAARTAQMIANSASVRSFYLRQGVPGEKITVIPAGVPMACSLKTGRSALMLRHGLPDDAKLIAYLGPLTKQKRLKELVWATDQLKAVGIAAHLLIVGEGPLRQPLKRYARLNRIGDRVHFLGQCTDIKHWLPNVDLLWQAGNCEGQSQAILEAMAAGIPVVAADVPGNRELVVPGETGYLVPLRERAGFARYSLPLMEDPNLAHRLGAAGQQRIVQHHSVSEMLAQHMHVYRHALA